MKTRFFALVALFALVGFLEAADAPGMLRILAYDRTISRELCLEFTAKTGIPVDVTTVASSMEAANMLYRKKESFDLLLLSSGVVQAMRDRGQLFPLDQKKITKFSKVQFKWGRAAGDPKGEFRIPMDVAAMGLLVDQRAPQPEVTGYLDAFRKPRPGGVAVIVDQRDLLAAALLSLGASVNDLSPDNLKAARVLLRGWLGNIAPASKEIWGTGHTPAFKALRTAIVEGRHPLALIYSGDALSLMTEYPNRFRWINPVEGSLKYMTVFAIPKDSNRPDAAHRFIDFLLDPQIASQIAVAPGFGIHIGVKSSLLPLKFYGNPNELAVDDLMDNFSVQSDITREPRAEMQALFDSLPPPSAPAK